MHISSTGQIAGYNNRPDPIDLNTILAKDLIEPVSLLIGDTEGFYGDKTIEAERFLFGVKCQYETCASEPGDDPEKVLYWVDYVIRNHYGTKQEYTHLLVMPINKLVNDIGDPKELDAIYTIAHDWAQGLNKKIVLIINNK
ncbi:MAG: hypothetical protein JST75_14895 [Bacteroidetes bacterium]|nr:hypothetical protein [Bacteroidota bacterium]